ncbi:hypothetical protein ROLI_018690 [Roseobacter fucihabitans]|uniref:Uncharacterized protein n=1 Tax=Roseobacter fucihabitans TaxID=1537242 RepID=A0ABZ2BS14_9RHOB|nr:hypothetical protein [Roseobacter litoralis]
MRSFLATFRPQAKKYRAVNILSLNGETEWGSAGPHFFCAVPKIEGCVWKVLFAKVA